MKLSRYNYLFIAFIAVQAVLFFAIKDHGQAKIDDLLKVESKTIQTEYKSIYKTFEDLANTVFHGYINKPEITQIIKNKNREELYSKLQKSYRYLTSIDFKQIHFHTKDNISFLRMHKPEKYGDNLTDFRYSIDYTNTNKTFISGLELGRVVPGFRFLYPLYDDQNKHIGSVEASFAVEAFTKKLTELFNVQTNFIIKKEIIKEEIFNSSSSQYTTSLESSNYLLLQEDSTSKISKNKNKIKSIYSESIKQIVEKKMGNETIFSLSARIDEYDKIITFLPAFDIEKKHIGYFVVYHDSSKLTNIIEQTNYEHIIGFLLVLGIFFIFYKNIQHKYLLELEVDDKTKKLTQTTILLEEQTSELEEMNDSLEDKIKIEIDKNAKQERELFQQSKQAALGDMIGNIAHQWRQPLSAISTAASGMQLTYIAGVMNDEDFMNYTDAITYNAKYLSQTIDDFRDFVKNDKKITRFDISESIEKCMKVVNSSINNHNLHIKTNFDKNIFISNFDNELQQAVINIFANAKDALKENIANSDDRVIFISTYLEADCAIVSIKDTAGGISEDIMDKIFEPYFTTKHQSQGTGLGLYMTHQIICNSMNGTIEVHNDTFTFNDKEYTGAEFIIKLKI